jgi:hypothetical protein
VDLSLIGTEFKRIPVKFGIMKPPKKRRSQRRIAKYMKLLTKGIGTATIKAQILIPKQR